MCEPSRHPWQENSSLLPLPCVSNLPHAVQVKRVSTACKGFSSGSGRCCAMLRTNRYHALQTIFTKASSKTACLGDTNALSKKAVVQHFCPQTNKSAQSWLDTQLDFCFRATNTITTREAPHKQNYDQGAYVPKSRITTRELAGWRAGWRTYVRPGNLSCAWLAGWLAGWGAGWLAGWLRPREAQRSPESPREAEGG